MKRPLAAACACFTAVAAVVYCFSFWAALAFSLLLALLPLIPVLCERRGKKHLIRCAVFALAALALCAVSLSREAEAEQLLNGRTCEVRLTVTETSGTRCRARIERCEGERISGTFAVFYDPEGMLGVGDEADCVLRFSEPDGVMTSKDSLLLYYPTTVSIGHADRGAHPIITALNRTRRFLESVLKSVLPQEGALAAAMLTGEKSNLSAEDRILFSRSGISHILAVSGLHITLLAAALKRLLRFFGCPTKLSFPILSVYLIVLSAFYGFIPSVVRAAVMYLLTELGELLERPSDPLTNLSVASVAVLAFCPKRVVSASYLLSFGCVLALVGILPGINSRLDESVLLRNRNAVVRTGCKTVADAILLPLLTAPILSFCGMAVSLVSPAVNLLILPLVPFLMGSGILSFVFGALFPHSAASVLAAGFCGGLCKLSLAIIRVFGSMKYAAIPTHPIPLLICFGLGIFLFRHHKILEDRPKQFGILALLTLLLFSLQTISQWVKFHDPEILRVTVIEDEAVLLHLGDSRAAIFADGDFDCYREEDLKLSFFDAPEYVIILNGESASEADSRVVANGETISFAQGRLSFSGSSAVYRMPDGTILTVTLDGTGAVPAAASVWLGSGAPTVADGIGVLIAPEPVYRSETAEIGLFGIGRRTTLLLSEQRAEVIG